MIILPFFVEVILIHAKKSTSQKKMIRIITTFDKNFCTRIFYQAHGLDKAEEMHSTGLDYKVIPRLRECCRQVEVEVASNSSNKIHQTWEWPYSGAL